MQIAEVIFNVKPKYKENRDFVGILSVFYIIVISGRRKLQMAHIKRFVIDNWWCLLIIITLLLSRIWLGTAIVSGTSMNNTLAEDDLLLIHKTKDVDRNDIVAIWYDGRTEYLCKRVIGVAGDKISVIQTILVTHRGLNVDSPYQSAP